MTASETHDVLALYRWAAGNPALRALVVFTAQQPVFFIPHVLLAAWCWQATGRGARRLVLVAAGRSALLDGLTPPPPGHLTPRSRSFVARGVGPVVRHAAERSFPSRHTLLGGGGGHPARLAPVAPRPAATARGAGRRAGTPASSARSPATRVSAALDIGGWTQQSKIPAHYLGWSFDAVITVRGAANEPCPGFPGASHRL